MKFFSEDRVIWNDGCLCSCMNGADKVTCSLFFLTILVLVGIFQIGGDIHAGCNRWICSVGQQSLALQPMSLAFSYRLRCCLIRLFQSLFNLKLIKNRSCFSKPKLDLFAISTMLPSDEKNALVLGQVHSVAGPKYKLLIETCTETRLQPDPNKVH